MQRRRGVTLEVLQPEELRQLEPSLAPNFHRAVFYPDVAHTVNNFRFVRELAASFVRLRSEEHTSELQSLMRISYAVFCLKKKNIKQEPRTHNMTTTPPPKPRTAI